MSRYKIAAILSLLIIAGCTPHPGAGVWTPATENTANISRVDIYFDPKVEIFTGSALAPAMQCGWWALDKTTLEMECVHLADVDKKETFQLKVIAEDKAELKIQDGISVSLIRQRD